MGLLSCGIPLDWEETKQQALELKKNGVQQFINLYHKFKDRTFDIFRWGDEVEYLVIRLTQENEALSNNQAAPRKSACLNSGETSQLPDGGMASGLILVRACVDFDAESRLIPLLNAHEHQVGKWNVEQSSFMLESTPQATYSGVWADYSIMVEASMWERRQSIKKWLNSDQLVLTMGNFPRLGCADSMISSAPYDCNLDTNHITESLYLSERVFTSHPRFRTLAVNCKKRRGNAKVAINVPKFVDKQTDLDDTDPKVLFKDALFVPTDPMLAEKSISAALPAHIYMDAMSFGMGCTCLQVTFQAENMSKARSLFDQLVPLAPIMMAITASTPIYRGILSDRDCRWDVIAASVDDRTKEEVSWVPKSRYSSVSQYLSCNPLHSRYNDVAVPLNQDSYHMLINAGIDNQLATHVAHLFLRDPLVVYRELLDQDNASATDHFENIQSTNWQSVRFKPPPSFIDCNIGWRIEFRTLENQLDDFSNAAFAVFTTVLVQALIANECNLYMPISLVDLNMQRAQFNNALQQQRFYFPCKTVFQPDPNAKLTLDNGIMDNMVVEQSIDQIFNGPGGLIEIIHNYLNDTQSTSTIAGRKQLEKYIQFISMRAAGLVDTPAQWIRKFVQTHPCYSFDSMVNSQITSDLILAANRIANRQDYPSSLFGTLFVQDTIG